MARKVWFITGTSKGFGRVWAEAALSRGNRVAATARNLGSLAPLASRFGDDVAAMKLDVTDRGAVNAAIAQAHQRFGRLDVVINNAGYGLFGTVEEISETQARAQMETNLFGALWVTQAALPIMRTQRSGHNHSGFIHRRDQRVSDGRYVSRLQVGARGLKPIARRGSGRVRNKGDAH
jgi:NADP-dependent 3-hydroxy acid dehydrogenase YdfG